MNKLFIGSSSQSTKYAKAVKSYFVDEGFEVDLWTQITNPGDVLISKLTEKISRCDFTIFVFAMDDILLSKNKEHSVVRDNVILELGISIGILGLDRSFILREEDDNQSTKILSDLGGVIYTRYRKPSQESIKNVRESVEAACEKIHEGIESVNRMQKPNIKRELIYELIEGTLHSICRAAGMPKSANEFRAFYFEKEDMQLVSKKHWSLNPVVNQEDRLSFDLNEPDLKIAVVRSGLGEPSIQFDDINESNQIALAREKPVSQYLKYVISKVVLSSESNEVIGVISIDTHTEDGKEILMTDNHQLADYMITNTRDLISKIHQL